MEETKETYAEENITCPNCLKVTNHDSWERSADSGEEVCHYCDSAFKWDRDVSVSYSSSLIATVPEID